MSKKIILAALGAVVSMGIGSQTAAAEGVSGMAPGANVEMMKMHAPATNFEKCYGIVKAGKNDCATKTEACAGQSKANGAKDAWIGVPKGTCDKIVGGSTTQG
jgi:uncharacterized membrane protein